MRDMVLRSLEAELKWVRTGASLLFAASGRAGAAEADKGRAADSAYDAVKHMAIEYRSRPGERVNEVEVTKRLSLSRTPAISAPLPSRCAQKTIARAKLLIQ